MWEIETTPALDDLDGVAFTTDRVGVIAGVGSRNWNAFASGNGAPELRAEDVIDRNLFDFIEGAQVRDHLKCVLDRISRHPSWCWVLPFRCDSPEHERVFCQTLRPLFTGPECTGFLFQSIEQSRRLRPPVPLFDFPMLRRLAEEDPTLPLVEMCSWCQRVRYPPDPDRRWVEAEDYYAAGGRSAVRLSHGICEDCLAATIDPFLTDGEADGRD